jgi:hypothetical protein
VIYTPELLEWYPFEGTGASAVGGVNLTGTGTPTYAAGPHGRATALNGTSQYWTRTGRVAVGSQFSAMIWVYLSATGAVRQAMAQAAGKAATETEWTLGVLSTNILYAALHFGGTESLLLSGPGAVGAGEWHLLGLSIYQSGATRRLRLVIDGEIDDEGAFGADINTSGDRVAVGVRHSAAPDRYWSGRLANAQIYSGEFTADDWARVYSDFHPIRGAA